MSVILATAGYDHKVRFWEAPSGICSRTIRHPDSQVNCLEITPDKQFLAAGGNPQIRLFEINNSANHNPVLTLEGHTGSVTSLGFQREGRFLYSGSEDGETSQIYSCLYSDLTCRNTDWFDIQRRLSRPPRFRPITRTPPPLSRHGARDGQTLGSALPDVLAIL